MTSRPWMPFYGADFLNDTAHLTPLQRGAYLLLLWRAWCDPTGSLPADHHALARVCDVHPRTFTRWIAAAVLPFFTVDRDGRLRQKRLSAELQKYRKIAGERKEQRKKGRLFIVDNPVDNPVNSCGQVRPDAGPNRYKFPNEINGRPFYIYKERDSESYSETQEAVTARATTTKRIQNNSGKSNGAAPHRPASNAAAKRDVSPPSHTPNPRQAWENELAKHLGPDDYAKVIPILGANPDIGQRATDGERRQPGTGAGIAAIGLQKHLRRSP